MTFHDLILDRPDGPLHASACGPAPDLVLLHAGGERRKVWRPVMTSLWAAGLASIAYDQRGHGDSVKSLPTGLPDITHDTRAMIGQADAAVIAGCSLGGFAALTALEDPAVRARVSGLVMIDVVPCLDPAPVRRFLAGAAGDVGASPLVDDILGRIDWLCDCARVLDLPVLLIRAGHGTALTDEGAARFRALTPHLDIVTIPEAEHLVARTAPDQLARHLIAFTTSQAVAARRELIRSV